MLTLVAAISNKKFSVLRLDMTEGLVNARKDPFIVKLQGKHPKSAWYPADLYRITPLSCSASDS